MAHHVGCWVVGAIAIVSCALVACKDTSCPFDRGYRCAQVCERGYVGGYDSADCPGGGLKVAHSELCCQPDSRARCGATPCSPGLVCAVSPSGPCTDAVSSRAEQVCGSIYCGHGYICVDAASSYCDLKDGF